MNHDNQKPIPEDKLREMRLKAKGYHINTIPDYPKNNTHLQAYTHINLGFDIVYNSDGYILKYDDEGNGILQSENKWAVLATDSNMFKYNEEFDDVEDAISYAYEMYELHITSRHCFRMNQLRDIKKVREGN